MKRNLLFLSIAVVLILSSCEVIIVEEPIPGRVDYRDYFVGYYDAEEYNTRTGQYAEYGFRIVRSGYSGSVYIRNFYGVGIEVIADVEGYDIYIPEQVVDGYHIEGDGYINGNELILNYSVDDHLDSHSYVSYYEVVAWR